jgi:hypothetical protein
MVLNFGLFESESKLQLFDIGVLRKIIGPKEAEVISC